MVVRAYWPGATAQQMAEQVTDKLERTLQEAPYVDKIRSYSKPGETQIILELQRLDAAEGRAERLVPGAQEDRRHRAARCRPACQGPFFNDEFGDIYGSIFALSGDGFTYAELRTTPTTCASSCCACRRGQGRAVRRAGREDLHRVLAADASPSWACRSTQMRQPARARRTRSSRAGVLVTPHGQPAGARDRRSSTTRRAAGGPAACAPAAPRFRLGDFADVQRGYDDPPHDQDALQRQGSDRRWACRWTRAATSSSWARRCEATVGAHPTASCRSASSWSRCRTSRRRSPTSVNEFVHSADRGGGDRAGRVSFVALGLHSKPALRLVRRRAPGPGGGADDPAGAGVTFLSMNFFGIGAAQDLAGRADHRARPAGGRRHHRGRDDGAEDGGGLRQGSRRHLRLRRRPPCRC